jgi:hypothetical protein
VLVLVDRLLEVELELELLSHLSVVLVVLLVVLELVELLKVPLRNPSSIQTIPTMIDTRAMELQRNEQLVG